MYIYTGSIVDRYIGEKKCNLLTNCELKMIFKRKIANAIIIICTSSLGSLRQCDNC
jgi:hypothetical protein